MIPKRPLVDRWADRGADFIAGIFEKILNAATHPQWAVLFGGGLTAITAAALAAAHFR